MDIDSLRSINTAAIDKLGESVAALNELLDDPETSLDDQARLLARRASLNAEIDSQTLVRAHLRASQLIVDFTAAEEAKLDSLNEEMDAYIVSGLRIEAMLSLVPSIVDTSMSLRNLATAHTGIGARVRATGG